MKFRFKATLLSVAAITALTVFGGQMTQAASNSDSSVNASSSSSSSNSDASSSTSTTDSSTTSSSSSSSSSTSSKTSSTTSTKKKTTSKTKTTKKTTKKKTTKKKKTVKRHKTKYQPYYDPTDMRKRTGNYWKYSSETKTKYPNLKKVKNLNLRVSILGNRVYVRSGKKVLYTMYCSAGRIVKGKSLTPTGTYYTNSYHPYRFSSGLYPVGWIGQEYLFHSVPTYEWSKTFIASETHKVGKTPASHGCIRLTVKDAKWLHYHIPYHTKVIIKNR